MHYPGSSLWIEQPHRVLAARMLYFLRRTLGDVDGGIRPGAPPAFEPAGARTHA